MFGFSLVTHGKPQESKWKEESIKYGVPIGVLNSCGEMDEEDKYIMISIEKNIEKSCICGNDLLENGVESSNKNGLDVESSSEPNGVAHESLLLLMKKLRLVAIM